MNRIYKIVWSKAKNAYVVTSELAKNHTKSASGKAMKAALAALLLTGISVSPVFAAIDGVTTFVEPGNQNIRIGNDTELKNNAATNGAIVIGDHAQINDYVMQEGSIAIGKNAFVENLYGRQEKNFTFGQSDEKKWASSITIGQNTYARSGSVMIGDHKYIGKLGDAEVDGSDVNKVRSRNMNINATTLGANSYNQGAFSTVNGAYSIISGQYDGSFWTTLYAGQNFGATITGSLNSIESATSSSMYSGVANSIVGTANRTANSNGSLIFGAGNEITNSITSLSGTPTDGGASAKDLADTLRSAVRNSESGGATLAIGGGNKADYTQKTSIIGVNNTVTGTSRRPSTYNSITGFKNAATNVNHVSVIGSENEVENTNDALVLGNKRKLAGANGSVILGSGDSVITTNVENAVAIGSEANVEKDGGVALGADSIASVDKGVEGYDPAAGNHANDTTGTWKATAAAVSVGKAADPTGAAGSPAITRQITNVAAGTQDTDAVNVAQLKAVQAAADASKVHYYSVNDKGYHVGNYNNDGAKGGMALAAGAGAAANGTASTVTGAFSRVDGDGVNGFTNGFQGATSSVYGTFNVVGAKNGVKFDGVANSIVGVANKTENANAALIFGAGNKVTNSYRPVDMASAAPLASALQTAIQQGNTDKMIEALGALVKDSGGAVLAIGGANTADYAQLSKLVGVGNKLTGTENKPSAYNMIDGYLNTGKNINYVSVIGSENEVEDTDDALVLGNKRKLSGAGGSIILGSGNSTITTNVSDAVSIGHNANVKKAGGVALGAGSIASVDKGVEGYDPAGGDHANDTTGTWKATAAAVSVGRDADPTRATASPAITRQITNVAAGTQDTDAVNVAQLKNVEAKVAEEAAKHTTVTAGDYVTVTETETNGQKNYTVSGPKMESTDGTVKITDKVENGKKVGYNLSVNTSSLGIEKTEVTAGENVTVTSKKDGNKTTYTINAKDTVVTKGEATYALNGKGTAVLTNNDGSTATITGLRDIYTTSAALNGNTLDFTRNDGSTYSVSGIASTKDIWNITNKVDKLGTRVNKVGAGAAALAALHPLDFDPDDKWDIAAGYGNYKDAHAVAVGAFYRPNEDTMFSVGGSFGGGENMVNAGVSLKLGQGNHVSTSKVAMAKEIVDLRDENKDLKKRLDTMEQKMNSILGILDMGKKKDFPDVPENHWAYEYVATLAGNGIIEGYPDGMFGGDRSMTRYEFAAMFYRALKNGAPVDDNMDRAMNEFEPELRQIRLDRIRVDRISGKDNDRNKVERVRVNSEDDKAKNDYRDVYGSHISPKA